MTFVLRRKFVDEAVGVPHEDTTKARSLRKAQTHAEKNDGFVLTLPHLIDARMMPGNDEAWGHATALSEENPGRTRYNSKVVLVGHGPLYWNPERMETAVSAGLVNNGAGRIDDNVFYNLVEGKLPDGRRVDVLELRDFLNGTEFPDNFYILIDKDRIGASGDQELGVLRSDVLFQARAGSPKRAHDYLAHLERLKLKTYGNLHVLNEAKEAQGRVLDLSSYSSYNGFNGSNNLNIIGRFVSGVVPEAQENTSRGAGASEEAIVVHSLDDALADLSEFIPEACMSDAKEKLSKYLK